LTFVWTAAAKLPIVIVTIAITPKASTQSTLTATAVSSGNAPKKTRNPTANPAAFEADERNADTGAGDPSYASGAQKWKGTDAVLNATPPRMNRIPIPATPFRLSDSPSEAATSPNRSDPVAAYTSEIPKTKTADDTAPMRKYFRPASALPRLVLRNATNA
jgi:hypothetical protein